MEPCNVNRLALTRLVDVGEECWLQGVKDAPQIYHDKHTAELVKNYNIGAVVQKTKIATVLACPIAEFSRDAS